MNTRRKRVRKLRKGNICLALLLLIIMCIGVSFIFNTLKSNRNNDTNKNTKLSSESVAEITESLTTELITTEPPTEPPIYMEYPVLTPNSQQFTEEYTSLYGILIDTSTNEILGYKNHTERMYPASLTKVMTLIIAVENTENFYDTQIITSEMVDPMIAQDATRAGFAVGETPTITDLLYGVILPSGADASLALAQYISGSEAEFVKLMNEKCTELGLKNTHFTNCVGLHNDNHYSTAEDMALIMQYAMENEICRRVLTTYQYIVPPTEYNPDGLLLTSTMFGRMTGTEMPGVTVKGGKTGFTDQAGQCLASFAEINGKEYILVLANNASKWYVVYDTLSIYSIYGYGGTAYVPPQ